MRAAFLALIAGCSFTPGSLRGDASSDDTPSDGRTIDGDSDALETTLREKAITISTGAVGTQTSFPLWITLNDTEIASRARPDGQDIHFVDDSGIPLDYEIQRWSNGQLEAWVRVPSLTAGTALAIRYGDLAAAHPPNAVSVFGGFLAVWHLEDALTTGTIADARANITGTTTGLSTTDRVASAALGAGIDFKGGTDQIAFMNPLTGSGVHTISLWINQRTTTTNDAIVVLGNGSNNQARWFHSRFDQATIAVGFYGNDYANPAEDIQGDGWTLLHWTYDANRNSRLYRDGNLVAGPFQHATGVNTQGTTGLLGNAGGAFGSNMGLLATLDEVRITNILRSAEWIATESLNQTAPSTFYAVGAERIPAP